MIFATILYVASLINTSLDSIPPIEGCASVDEWWILDDSTVMGTQVHDSTIWVGRIGYHVKQHRLPGQLVNANFNNDVKGVIWFDKLGSEYLSSMTSDYSLSSAKFLGNDEQGQYHIVDTNLIILDSLVNGSNGYFQIYNGENQFMGSCMYSRPMFLRSEIERIGDTLVFACKRDYIRRCSFLLSDIDDHSKSLCSVKVGDPIEPNESYNWLHSYYRFNGAFAMERETHCEYQIVHAFPQKLSTCKIGVFGGRDVFLDVQTCTVLLSRPRPE